MDAIERLKRDHVILRAKMNVLEAALGMKTDTWFVLREICFTLSRQLRDHIRREDELVAACHRGLPPHVLADVALEHHDEPQLLRSINRLFVSEHGHSLEKIRPTLLGVIGGLRRHMDEEEKEMFPILERVSKGTALPQARSAKTTLDESMTVNRVVQEFPGAKPALEKLFVNIPIEGCYCLDEVAWRHGMEPQELIDSLEEVITACRCGEKKPALVEVS